jgi:hypothetical protein
MYCYYECLLYAYEDGLFTGYVVFLKHLILKSYIFWDIMLCSWLQVTFFEAHIASIFGVKVEAPCSSEMSVDFQQTTWNYIPEDRILHNHCCENLRFYIYY